jgi:hypothetical protein
MGNQFSSLKVSLDNNSLCTITNKQATNLFLKFILLSSRFYKWDKFTQWTTTLTTPIKSKWHGLAILSNSMKINS